MLFMAAVYIERENESSTRFLRVKVLNECRALPGERARETGTLAALHREARRVEKKLLLLSHGKVCYPLKTPYREGTIRVIFEPLASQASKTMGS